MAHLLPLVIAFVPGSTVAIDDSPQFGYRGILKIVFEPFTTTVLFCPALPT